MDRQSGTHLTKLELTEIKRVAAALQNVLREQYSGCRTEEAKQTILAFNAACDAIFELRPGSPALGIVVYRQEELFGYSLSDEAYAAIE